MQWQGRAAHQQLRAAVGGGAGLHTTAAASTRFAAAAATAKRAVTTQLSAPRFVVRPMSSLATPEYHKLADSWLEAMYATFEDLIDASDAAADFDVTLAVSVFFFFPFLSTTFLAAPTMKLLPLTSLHLRLSIHPIPKAVFLLLLTIAVVSSSCLLAQNRMAC